MNTLSSLLIILTLAVFVKSFPQMGLNDSGFIVNGRDADISEFPHQLALFDQGRYFCGAAVINPLFALTAAHCLVNLLCLLTLTKIYSIFLSY